MPRFRTADRSALTRLRPRPGVTDARAPFREAIASLAPGELLEFRAEGGESMRALKVNASRAATEANVAITHGETTDGALLVWLKSESGRRRRRAP